MSRGIRQQTARRSGASIEPASPRRLPAEKRACARDSIDCCHNGFGQFRLECSGTAAPPDRVGWLVEPDQTLPENERHTFKCDECGLPRTYVFRREQSTSTQ